MQALVYHGPRRSRRRRVYGLVPGLYRLPVSGLQPLYGVFSDGHGDLEQEGQGAGNDPGEHLADGGGSDHRKSDKRTLIPAHV